MNRLWLGSFTVALIAAALPASAQQTPTTEELWEIIQRQQAQIEALQREVEATAAQLAEANQRIDTTEAQVAATGDFVESLDVDAGERRTSIGGYGELHYNNLDADDPENDVDEIDLHRFVMFFGHEFTDRARFFSELEVEHSLAGEGAPGEVELEQAYIDFGVNETTSAQAGLFLLPLGILNETHEPPTFYGVERNDVESIVIPSTWWEAGAGLSGTSEAGFSWNFAVHSGLAMPTTGASAFRVRSGRQKVAEAIASDAAYTGRIRYTGIPGLELAASLQYQADPSQIAGDGLDDGMLLTAHAIWQSGDFGLRALYAGWSFDGAAIEAAGADDQSGWFIEPSYRLSDSLGIYARYEDLDGARDQERFSEWQTGFNYWPVPNVVLKFDYRARDHDVAGLDFDGFDLGLGYQF